MSWDNRADDSEDGRMRYPKGDAPLPPQLQRGETPDSSVVGTRCQELRNAPDAPPVHVGCPGWWSGFQGSAEDGFVCGCSCHLDGAGWPGWTDFLDKN